MNIEGKPENNERRMRLIDIINTINTTHYEMTGYDQILWQAIQDIDRELRNKNGLTEEDIKSLEKAKKKAITMRGEPRKKL
jgi:hypothetical protein